MGTFLDVQRYVGHIVSDDFTVAELAVLCYLLSKVHVQWSLSKLKLVILFVVECYTV